MPDLNKFNLSVSFLLASLFVLGSGCGQSQEDIDTLPMTMFRRSVLDQKARMLTLRFGPDRFVAYDLENDQLFKVWRGGVLWNGAAFNNLKTVQPESFGNAYWEDSGSAPQWWLEAGGDRKPAQLKFVSFWDLNDGPALDFQLQDEAGHTALIRERPRFRETDEATVFERRFSVGDASSGVTVYREDQALEAGKMLSIQQAGANLPAAAPPAKAVSTNNNQYWLERSGCNTCHNETEKEVGPSYTAIAAAYEASKENITLLTTKVQNGGSGTWGSAAMIPHPHVDEDDIRRMIQYILSLRPKEPGKVNARPRTVAEAPQPERPGFGISLEAVHPGLELVNFRPHEFKPRVGGMAFLPDGRLLVSTWDSIGAVYALTGVASGDSNQVTITKIASGLSEPLGLTTVGNEIFVLQKQELTQLVDHDEDGIVDEYRQLNDNFGVTPDFHEFSYGLAYHEGYFYGGLGLAMRLMSHEMQLEDRGTIFRMDRKGSFEQIATGLRQPNGIVINAEGEIFVTENQGQWVPGCKIVHVQEGHFYGCQFGTGDRYTGLEASPPAVWLPQDEIGNSPGQPLFVQEGIYAGQMIHGEVSHGGVKRVFLEKVNGQYQGVAFRFTQGLEAGINRMAWGPDGALYVGGVGMNGGWAHREHQYGLQKLIFKEKTAFEMLAIRAQPGGFEIEFTQPVEQGISTSREMINLQQWYYQATAAYGGPKLDLQDLSISSATFNADRTKLNLQISGLKAGYVVYFNLSPEWKSQTGDPLWSGDAWYTLNNLVNEAPF